MFSYNKGYLCCGCGQRYGTNEYKYAYRDSCICNGCFKEFTPFAETACFEAKQGLDFLTPAFSYTGLYRDIFLSFKFNGKFAYGHILSMAIEDCFKNRDYFSDYSYIVPVPISAERMNERGYNQSLIMAKYVSKALGIPLVDALVRKRNSLPQSKVAAHRRAANVKGAFGSTVKFCGEKIIIFDDIYTTGSTVLECAKALVSAGAGGACVISGAYIFWEDKDPTIHRFL